MWADLIWFSFLCIWLMGISVTCCVDMWISNFSLHFIKRQTSVLWGVLRKYCCTRWRTSMCLLNSFSKVWWGSEEFYINIDSVRTVFCTFIKNDMKSGCVKYMCTKSTVFLFLFNCTKVIDIFCLWSPKLLVAFLTYFIEAVYNLLTEILNTVEGVLALARSLFYLQNDFTNY